MRGNILVITYWSYKEALIQTYTLPYLRILKKYLAPGKKIFLVTFEQSSLKLDKEELKKVRTELAENRISLIIINHYGWGLKYFASVLKGFFRLLFLIITTNISYIHAWCTPAGCLGLVLSLISGKKLVIDSYEPHSQAMVENGAWKKSGWKFKVLMFLEKQMSRYAIAVIGTTSGMRDYAKHTYGVTVKNFFVKPACVDLKTFNLDIHYKEDKELSNKIVCLYAGKIGDIYLKEELFDFLKVALDYWGKEFHFLLLTSHSQTFIEELASKSKFPKSKITRKFIPHQEIPKYMSLASFAITPVKPVPSKKYCSPIKDGEYWAMGLPVVITKNISDDSEIIEKNNAGAVIKSLTAEGYLDAIKNIDAILKEESVEVRRIRIRKLAEKYRNFNIAEDVYKHLMPLLN